MPSLIINAFNGLNANDQQDELIRRSHSLSEGGWSPLPGVGVESPSMDNVDFRRQGIAQRNGSVARASSPTLAGETVLPGGAHTWIDVTNVRVIVIVTTVSIWTNQSGSWAKLDSPDGATEFTWNSTPAKVTFVEMEGHLVIGTDTNYNQVYRNGASLDDKLHAHLPASNTTVDADSASGQKVLNVANTTKFSVQDRIIIDDGGTGDGEETGYVASIQDGVSLTLVANLSITHLGASADAVNVENLWTNAVGGITNVVLGAWNIGNYIIENHHNRLVMSVGDHIREFTVIDKPYDNFTTGSGSMVAPTAIRAMVSFTPQRTDVLGEILYVFDRAGNMHIQTGFTDSDDQQTIGNVPVPINHKCFAKAKNWLIYLNEDKGITAINGTRVIDIGRRAFSHSSDGVLDQLNLSDGATMAFGFYEGEKQAAHFYFPTGADTTNSNAIIIDMQLGEPVPGEAANVYERRVRLLHWKIDTPGSNPWWIALIPESGTVTGVLTTGLLYQTRSGSQDLDSLAIKGRWMTPIFGDNAIALGKDWLTTFLRGLSTGNFETTVKGYLDRSTSSSFTFTYNQQSGDGSVYGTAVYGTGVYSSDGLIRGVHDPERYSETLQLEVLTNETNETWLLSELRLDYIRGAEIR